MVFILHALLFIIYRFYSYFVKTNIIKTQETILPWHQHIKIKWAAPSEFVTYRLCEQRRFRRACASAQSRQNLRCSLIQAVNQEEPSDRKPDPWPLWMAGHARLKFVMTECLKTQIRLAGLKCWQKIKRISDLPTQNIFSMLVETLGPIYTGLAGLRLGQGSREKWLLPPDQIGRSDSQEGRSGSGRLQHFSLNFKEK